MPATEVCHRSPALQGSARIVMAPCRVCSMGGRGKCGLVSTVRACREKFVASIDWPLHICRPRGCRSAPGGPAAAPRCTVQTSESTQYQHQKPSHQPITSAGLAAAAAHLDGSGCSTPRDIEHNAKTSDGVSLILQAWLPPQRTWAAAAVPRRTAGALTTRTASGIATPLAT